MYEADPRKTCRTEGCIGCARRDCRCGDGPARIAAEVAGEGARRGGDGHDLEEFKTLVTEVLTRARVGDPAGPGVWSAGGEARNGKGLLLAYEKTGYDAHDAGPAAGPAGRVERAAAEGGGRGLHQDPAVLHAV